jgi:glycosyltransferase involved in cell wall biosynthesis
MNLSIITICFNNLSELIKTCDSIDCQIEKPFEHIIINGSTNEEIKEWFINQNKHAYRTIVNELDGGISDAFNKGIAKSKGDVIHLLNSGDIYFDENIIQIVSKKYTESPNAQWLSGNILLHRGGWWVSIGKPFDKNQVFKGMRSISHPTWFVKKEVYERIGLYKNFKIAMDYDMMCRIKDEPYAYINYTIAKFDHTGVSSLNYLDSLKQNVEVYESNFGFSIKSRFWQFRLMLLHHFLQTWVGKKVLSLKMKFNK